MSKMIFRYEVKILENVSIVAGNLFQFKYSIR